MMENSIEILDLTIIIPTYNRPDYLLKTLLSIAEQNFQPIEILIIDSSNSFDDISKKLPTIDNGLKSRIIHIPAFEKGAAAQRNQGISMASHDIIGFFDDDILLENNCIKNLWLGLQEHPTCGGINAVITNQSYHPLGKFSKFFYKIMGADTKKSLAGKCIGPAVNFLPDLNAKDNFIPVDWLNTTCTLYRKEALPHPVFDKHFTGYSLMEDLALSLRVGKSWQLLTANKARIFHDSQPSEGKNNIFINAEMDLVNRYYIMKYILEKNSLKDSFKLFMQQLFGAVASKNILSSSHIKGKYSALKKIKSL